MAETEQKKIIPEYEKKIDSLQKELAKKDANLKELVEFQVKVLEDAIIVAQGIVKSNEETIKTNR